MMRSLLLFAFFIVFNLVSCRSKSDQLKTKLTLLLPKNTSQSVLAICKKFIDDCVMMFKEIPQTNRTRVATYEDYQKVDLLKKKFALKHPDNFMIKTSDQIFAEKNISNQDEKKVINDFLQRMMEGYFQFIQ